MLGSPILYLKGRRRMMFQLSGFYCNQKKSGGSEPFALAIGKFRAYLCHSWVTLYIFMGINNSIVNTILTMNQQLRVSFRAARILNAQSA